MSKKIRCIGICAIFAVLVWTVNPESCDPAGFCRTGTFTECVQQSLQNNLAEISDIQAAREYLLKTLEKVLKVHKFFFPEQSSQCLCPAELNGKLSITQDKLGTVIWTNSVVLCNQIHRKEVGIC